MTEPQPQPASLFVHLLRQAWFWFGLLGIFFGIAIIHDLLTADTEPPALYGTVPEFSLTAQSGSPYGSSELRGKTWVSNFIFTRCKTVCPIFSSKMSILQSKTRGVGDDLQLISFSVDPEFDTPAVLAEYSKRFNANPHHWQFLTGPTDKVRAVVIDGLKTFMGDAATVEAPEELMHGSHFVLVDPDMNIRGFYQSEDEDTMDRLLLDIELVINEER